MGTSRWYGNSRENGSPGGDNSENLVFPLFFPWMFGQKPSQNVPTIRPIILHRSKPPSTTPDPFYIGFTFLISCGKKKVHFWCMFEVFPIFSWFVELRRLWDQSQIVDLIFAVRTVASRASETSKVPHSWQNNVPKRSTKYFIYFHYFLSSWGSGTSLRL